RLHIELITRWSQVESREIRSEISRPEISQRHQVFTVAGSKHGVVVNGALAAGDGPGQRRPLQGGREGKAVIDAALDLGAFLVVVPGDQLKVLQLIAAAVVLSRFGHRGQPGLSAELQNLAILSPQGQRIIEALEARTKSLERGELQRRAVEIVEIGQAHVAGSNRCLSAQPGEAAAGLRLGEATRVAKDENRIAR